MTCSQCEGIEETFDEESIRKELKFYRRDGADDTTRWLIEALQAQNIDNTELLDIGGGIGAIQHELLESGARSAVHVDGSRAYIDGAKEEAERRGLVDKIEWSHGDFTELAKDLKKADIVTLDRVICCYDDMRALVSKSLVLSKKYYGVVHPRDTWYTQLGFRVINFIEKLFGNKFRAFVHPVKEIESLVKQNGFQKIFARNNFLWQVSLYSR